jgi:hypothetical protein
VSHPSPVESFIGHLVASLQAGTMVRLHLSHPVPATAEGPALDRIVGRLIDLRGEPTLSLSLREAKRDTTQNLALADVPGWFSRQFPAAFRSAVLETTVKTWQLSLSPRGGLRLGSHLPETIQAPPARAHDVSKATALGTKAQPWLIQLGICSDDGRVRASMASKLRQIERYLEILTHLSRDCGWKPGEAVAVADMGSGKGYLTFGVWHLLTRVLGLRADVTGVEARGELVERTNAVARAVGAEGLRFISGTIVDAELPRLDALMALHACNTATDDAIRRGIAAQAKLIVVSPCCHQELRAQLGRPEPLAPLLAHGILAERMSEWLTDGLRALHLEAAGYATKVIEFVPSEHTPRNLLIAGIRQENAGESGRARAVAEIHRLRTYFGIEHHALDDLLPD